MWSGPPSRGGGGMHEGCIRRYPREVGGTTPVAYEDLGRPSNRLAAALAEVLLLEGVHGIVLGRQDSMGVGPRACALVGPFAYREVLADDEVPEFDDVPAVAVRGRDRLWAEQEPVVDPGAVRRLRPEDLVRHDVRQEVHEHVGEDDEAPVRVAVLLGDLRERGHPRLPGPRPGRHALGQPVPEEPVVLDDAAALVQRHDLAQLRMHGRAVETLVEILDDDLPVRPTLVRLQPRETQVTDTVPSIRRPVRPELPRERFGGRREVHEEEPLPDLQGDPIQRVFRAINALELRDVWRPDKVPFQGVRPGMVWALDDAW